MLTGSIDEAARQRVRGWVRDPAFPDAPVSLVVTADDRLVARTVANVRRPDVARAGIGNGAFGFDVAINPPLSPARSWVVRVQAEADGEDMPGSPFRIEASAEFDGEARRAFSAALDTFSTVDELESRISFLAEQEDRLLQRRAELRFGPSRVAKRALVIDDRAPQTGRDGGSDALLSHMRSLQRIGFAVTFATPAMPRGPAVAALEADSIDVCQTPWYRSVEELLRREAGRYDLVYLHRVLSAANYTTLVRECQSRARLIYSVADLHHLRLARQAAAEDRPELLAEAKALHGREVWAAQAADCVITHSAVEAGLLRQFVPAERVHVVAWAAPRRPAFPEVPFADRRGMAFIGNFSHAPNEAAARHLRDMLIPLIQQADPSIICQIVGSDIPHSFQTGQPGLQLTGHVEDLGGLLDSLRLTVAPLAYGAGLKSKVLESLAAGVPCVCSPIAAEGFDLPPPLDEFVVADPAAAVRAIVRLHNDAAYHARLAEAARAFAAEGFSPARLDAALRAATGFHGEISPPAPQTEHQQVTETMPGTGRRSVKSAAACKPRDSRRTRRTAAGTATCCQ